MASACGVAYTGMQRTALAEFDPYLTEADNKARNQHLQWSRPHNLVINYNYEMPGLSQHMWDNVFAKGVFDGWQISGIIDHAESERRRLHLRLHGRADGRPVGQRLGGTPRDAQLRSEPAAQRADVRPPVPHRVRRPPGG